MVPETWVSIRGGGVFRLHGGAWSRIEFLTDAVEMTAYGAIADDQGRIWLAYPERREIGLWDHGNIRVFSSETGLNVGEHPDRLRGREHLGRWRIWVGPL